MAEVLAKDYFKKTGKSHKVQSAGLHSSTGEPASEMAISAVKELGLDLTKHKNQLVNRELIETGDLVLTMTLAQRDLLRIAFFDLKEIDLKIETLSAYAGLGDIDIEDPYMGQLEKYLQTRDQIKELIEKCNWEE